MKYSEVKIKDFCSSFPNESLNDYDKEVIKNRFNFETVTQIKMLRQMNNINIEEFQKTTELKDVDDVFEIIKTYRDSIVSNSNHFEQMTKYIFDVPNDFITLFTDNYVEFLNQFKPLDKELERCAGTLCTIYKDYDITLGQFFTELFSKPHMIAENHHIAKLLTIWKNKISNILNEEVSSDRKMTLYDLFLMCEDVLCLYVSCSD